MQPGEFKEFKQQNMVFDQSILIENINRCLRLESVRFCDVADLNPKGVCLAINANAFMSVGKEALTAKSKEFFDDLVFFGTQPLADDELENPEVRKRAYEFTKKMNAIQRELVDSSFTRADGTKLTHVNSHIVMTTMTNMDLLFTRNYAYKLNDFPGVIDQLYKMGAANTRGPVKLMFAYGLHVQEVVVEEKAKLGGLQKTKIYTVTDPNRGMRTFTDPQEVAKFLWEGNCLMMTNEELAKFNEATTPLVIQSDIYLDTTPDHLFHRAILQLQKQLANAHIQAKQNKVAQQKLAQLEHWLRNYRQGGMSMATVSAALLALLQDPWIFKNLAAAQIIKDLEAFRGPFIPNKAPALYGSYPIATLWDEKNEAFSDLGKKILQEACLEGDLEVVQECIQIALAKGEKGKAALNYHIEGDSLLIAAINGGQLDVFISLLNAGVNPNTIADNGKTPLWYAAGHGHDEMLHILLQTNDPNFANKDGITPLHSAASRGHEHCAAQLLASGANAWVETKSPIIVEISGQKVAISSALDLAALKGHLNIVKQLLQSPYRTQPEEKMKPAEIDAKKAKIIYSAFMKTTTRLSDINQEFQRVTAKLQELSASPRDHAVEKEYLEHQRAYLLQAYSSQREIAEVLFCEIRQIATTEVRDSIVADAFRTVAYEGNRELYEVICSAWQEMTAMNIAIAIQWIWDVQEPNQNHIDIVRQAFDDPRLYQDEATVIRIWRLALEKLEGTYYSFHANQAARNLFKMLLNIMSTQSRSPIPQSTRQSALNQALQAASRNPALAKELRARGATTDVVAKAPEAKQGAGAPTPEAERLTSMAQMMQAMPQALNPSPAPQQESKAQPAAPNGPAPESKRMPVQLAADMKQQLNDLYNELINKIFSQATRLGKKWGLLAFAKKHNLQSTAFAYAGAKAAPDKFIEEWLRKHPHIRELSQSDGRQFLNDVLHHPWKTKENGQPDPDSSFHRLLTERTLRLPGQSRYKKDATSSQEVDNFIKNAQLPTPKF